MVLVRGKNKKDFGFRKRVLLDKTLYVGTSKKFRTWFHEALRVKQKKTTNKKGKGKSR